MPRGLRKDDVVKGERYPLRNYDVISRPPKTEGQYKTSIASDGIFLPCLRGGVEGGGVTNRGSNVQSPFPTGDI